MRAVLFTTKSAKGTKLCAFRFVLQPKRFSSASRNRVETGYSPSP